MSVKNETGNKFFISCKKKEIFVEPQKLIEYKTKSQIKNLLSIQAKQENLFSKTHEKLFPQKDKKMFTLNNFRKEENLLFNLGQGENTTEFLSTKYFSLSHRRPIVKSFPINSRQSKSRKSHPRKLNELVLKLDQNSEFDLKNSQSNQNTFIHKYMVYIDDLLRNKSGSPEKNQKDQKNSKFPLPADNRNSFSMKNFRDELDSYKKFLESTSNREGLAHNANIILRNSPFIDEKIKMKETHIKFMSKNIITENKYLNKVLQNVLRKVCYINKENQSITEINVVNLIKDEANKITKNLDTIFESYCKIKNFSHVVKEKDETFYLPFINSISETEKKSHNRNYSYILGSEGDNTYKTNNLDGKDFNPTANSFNKKIFPNTHHNFYKFNLTTIQEHTDDSNRLKSKHNNHNNNNQAGLKPGLDSINIVDNLKHETEEIKNRIYSSKSRKFSAKIIIENKDSEVLDSSEILDKTQNFKNSQKNSSNYKNTEQSAESLKSLEITNSKKENTNSINRSENKIELFKNIKKDSMTTDLIKNRKILNWLNLISDSEDKKRTKNTANVSIHSNRKSESNIISLSPYKIETDNLNLKPLQDTNSVLLNKSRSMLLMNRSNSIVNKNIQANINRERYLSFKKYNSERIIEMDVKDSNNSSTKMLRKLKSNVLEEEENSEKNSNSDNNSNLTETVNINPSHKKNSFSQQDSLEDKEKNTLSSRSKLKFYSYDENVDYAVINEKLITLAQNRTSYSDFKSEISLGDRKKSENENKLKSNTTNKKYSTHNSIVNKDKKLTNFKSKFSVLNDNLKSMRSAVEISTNLKNRQTLLPKLKENKTLIKKKTNFYPKQKVKLKKNKTKSKDQDQNLELEQNLNDENSIKNSSQDNSLMIKGENILIENGNENSQRKEVKFNLVQEDESSVENSDEENLEENYEEDDSSLIYNSNDEDNINSNENSTDRVRNKLQRRRSRTVNQVRMSIKALSNVGIEKDQVTQQNRVKFLADLLDQDAINQVSRRGAKKYTYLEKNHQRELLEKDNNTFKKYLIKKKASKSDVDQYKLKMKNMRKGLDNMNKVTSDQNSKKGLRKMNTMIIMKEVDLKINIEYFMMNPEISDDMRNKFLELQNQIELMKNFDSMSYVDNLQQHFADFKGEIESIQSGKDIEDRINKFYKNFNEWRNKVGAMRNFWNSKLKVKDNKCKFSLGPLMS